MDQRQARSRQKGFTLLEVMVAVAVMSMLAAAMTPVWINEYNEGRAKLTIEETQSILDAARKYRVQNGSWPGGATCISAVNALKGTTPPLLAGVTNINKFNQTLSTSCTATTFSIDQTVATDYDGVVANGLANTVTLTTPANGVRTTIGTPGSEPALDSKLSRVAETNAQLNRMETTLLLGGNNITEVAHIDANSLNVAGATTTGSLGVTGNATVSGQTVTNVLGVSTNALIGGNLGVVGTTALNGAVTVNADARFNGETDFRDIVKLNKVVTEGTSCSPTGAIARNSTGLTLSCQSGVWTNGAGTPDVRVASCTCYSSGCGCNPSCPAGYTLINRAFSGIDSNSHRNNRVHTGLCAK
ncbi:prepilin-type N-terminal cleavage/methylation domain-containing protein [Pseudomonas sp. NCHU5232]|uniref:prepilin-type N-terminal cleavage/methylation domain-containing protein n=1 Tax=Pseudomonas sp. NCHU5232 TaxID=3451356 RepID=UPI003F9C71E9